MSLQRAQGNRFVQRMAVQAKLMVGPADKYEKEADRVAEQVMSTTDHIQRQEEEDELQAKRIESLECEVEPDLEASIIQSLGCGQPLPKV